jgi:hypothetical protein
VYHFGAYGILDSGVVKLRIIRDILLEDLTCVFEWVSIRHLVLSSANVFE